MSDSYFFGKVWLPYSAFHRKLRPSNLVTPLHVNALIQENIFSDGANTELYSNLAILRICFYYADSCVLSIEGKPVISNGIRRVEEHEEPLGLALVVLA
ncbi:triphosphate tunel metalloenzyme 3-like [Quillaja saponaria]|uniref:Triphosphate tunel metalloenzyme 3-like n=1 Tax=Quillaja saponaria TaxID=32244 RepID=A0AAD7L5G6_QUISA|nr:triphosphate tunel metalloenzyme 3-like [Quillaja saponaria]